MQLIIQANNAPRIMSCQQKPLSWQKQFLNIYSAVEPGQEFCLDSIAGEFWGNYLYKRFFITVIPCGYLAQWTHKVIFRQPVPFYFLNGNCY